MKAAQRAMVCFLESSMAGSLPSSLFLRHTNFRGENRAAKTKAMRDGTLVNYFSDSICVCSGQLQLGHLPLLFLNLTLNQLLRVAHPFGL